MAWRVLDTSRQCQANVPLSLANRNRTSRFSVACTAPRAKTGYRNPLVKSLRAGVPETWVDLLKYLGGVVPESCAGLGRQPRLRS